MRYTHKLNKPDGNCNYFLIPDKEQCDNAENKLGKLEDLMEKYDIKNLSMVESAFISFITDFDKQERNYFSEIKTIEEELGIDLITLFKALKNGAYIPFYGQVVSLDRYKIDIANKRFIAKHFNGNEWEEALDFKDYGKTWALTKEELENE